MRIYKQDNKDKREALLVMLINPWSIHLRDSKIIMCRLNIIRGRQLKREGKVAARARIEK